MTERIIGTDWTRGGNAIHGGCFALRWTADGESLLAKSASSEGEICCAIVIPFAAMIALYAERPRIGTNVGNWIERLCFEASFAADFEADEGALMRELAPLAHAELSEMKLWKQRCLNAESELRRIRGEQHAPAPDYRISDAPHYVDEHEDGEEP